MLGKKRVKDYCLITIASFFYAVAVSMFSDANNLVPGGVSGIAILMNVLFPIGTGTWFFILNVPLIGFPPEVKTILLVVMLLISIY